MRNAEGTMRSAEGTMRKAEGGGDAARAAPESERRPGGRVASGFTLIEMMIVILLIVILSGMTFRMVSIMGRNNDVSRTRATLEKVGHALEEYRSSYGKYPEVKFYPIYADSDGDGVSDNFVGIRQPVAYEYPMLTGFDESSAESSAKSILNAESKEDYRYGVTGKKYGIFFTFGLVSYLIPRYNGVAGDDDSVKWLCGYYEKNGEKYQDSEHAFSHWRDNNDKPVGSSPGDPDRDLVSSRRTLMHLGSYLTDQNTPANVSGCIVSFLGSHGDGRVRKVSGELPLRNRAGEIVSPRDFPPAELLGLLSTWSALPGASRHHWGTDVDVIDAAARPEGYDVRLVPGEYAPGGPFAKLGAWLDELAADPGFAFARPYFGGDGKGGRRPCPVAPEPWHLSARAPARGAQASCAPEALRDLLRNPAPGEEIALASEVLAGFEGYFREWILSGFVS